MSAGNLPLRGVDRLLVAVQELSMARSLGDIVDIVRHAARDLCGADGATFILRDDDSCSYVDEDAISPLWSGQRFPMSDCVSGWAMLNRTAVVIPDIYADPRVLHDAYRPTFVRSLLMVPIRSLDPVGAIGNYWAEEHVATDEEIRLLQALADSASVAMENVSVYAELAASHLRATTDELTGLLNRRGFGLSAEATLGASRAAGCPATVIYLDVDGLKEVNDRDGHSAGDALIRLVGEVLRERARDKDVMARMGGDEFCVLAVDLPGTAEEVRQGLREALQARGARASIGVVVAPPASALTIGQLVNQADARMYADKAEPTRDVAS